jgi:hypothetical protein
LALKPQRLGPLSDVSARPGEVAQFRERALLCRSANHGNHDLGLVPISRLVTGDRLPLGRTTPITLKCRPRALRMLCGWGCGAQFTGRQMRAHFTICAKRPAASNDVDRRGGNWKVSADARQGGG